MKSRSGSTKILRLADLSEWQPSDAGVISSGFAGLDNILGGGFRPGELSIWSGVNSSGKSTLLGQVLLEAIDQGQAACAYSGELPDHIFRYWLELQAAGPSFLETVDSWTQGRIFYNPRPELVARIRNWYRERLFLCRSEDLVNAGKLIEAFTQAAQDYSCRIFLLDNLTMTVSRLHARDQYRAQRELILETVRFARENEAHVHIVVHPRKTTSISQLTKNDIGGSGDITNLADNVLVLARPSAKDIRGEKLDWGARLTVLKNRFAGRQDEDVYLGFDCLSHRFYSVGSSPEARKYGWELWDKTAKQKEGKKLGKEGRQRKKPQGGTQYSGQ